MTSDDKPAEKERHGHPAFIPAGILIGLGVGILLNHVGSGVLIGLGLGFLASSFVRHEDAGPEAAAPQFCGFAEPNWIMLLIGIFLILVGIGLVWTSLPIWPYLVAAFFILLGLGFIIRGFRK